jgi:hypothetical protein
VVADGSPVPAPSPVDPAEAGRTGRSYILPIAFAAGAFVAGGAALGFNIAGDQKYDAAKKANMPPPGGRAVDPAMVNALYQDANTRRYLAEAFGAAAIGCAGAAVYFFLRGGSDGGSQATALAPVASPRLTGLAVVGSW